MLVVVLLILLATSSGEELCSGDIVPDLDGAWVCNDNWHLLTTQHPSEIEGARKWLLYYELPKFYAVSKLRTIAMCDESLVLTLSASVWDERFERRNDDDLTKSPESNWMEVEVPDLDFISNFTQEYSGFARRSPIWRVAIDIEDDIDESCLPKLAFFARAGIAAMQHYVLDYAEIEDVDFPNSLPEPSDAPIQSACDRVTGVPSNVVSTYRLDTSFYRKYTSAYGIPVMGSTAIDDRALQRACYVVRFMLSDRKDLRDHMYTNKGRVAIIGRRETVPMVPEMRQYTWWTRRAAGGTYHNPVNVGAEENMLCERGDGYARNQDIFMHEFAHGIHLIACYTAIRGFNARLQRSFLSARSRGLWRNTYANTDNREYFAEGVQAFFEQQREGPVGGDGIQNHINTREELRRHDPTLYRIIEELFPCDNKYIPRCNDINQAQGLRQTLKMNCNGGTSTEVPPPASTTSAATTNTLTGGTSPTGTTPTTTGKTCRDLDESCSYWSGIGECDNNPDYMLNHCEKSCGKCGTTTTDTTPTTCTDDNTNCRRWARAGECSKNPAYMKVYCKKSCDECNGGSCSDSDVMCGNWARYCHSNRYVINNCKETCRLC